MAFPDTLSYLPPTCHIPALHAHHPSIDALATLHIHDICPSLLNPACQSVAPASKRRLRCALTAGRCSVPVSALADLCHAVGSLTHLSALTLAVNADVSPLSQYPPMHVPRVRGQHSTLPPVRLDGDLEAGIMHAHEHVPALVAALRGLSKLTRLEIRVRDAPEPSAAAAVVHAAAQLPRLQALHVPVTAARDAAGCQPEGIVNSILQLHGAPRSCQQTQVTVDLFAMDAVTEAREPEDVLTPCVPLFPLVRTMQLLCLSGDDVWLQPLTEPTAAAALTGLQGLTVFAGETPMQGNPDGYAVLEAFLKDLSRFSSTLLSLDVSLMSDWHLICGDRSSYVDYFCLANSLYSFTGLKSLRYCMFDERREPRVIPPYNSWFQGMPHLCNLDLGLLWLLDHWLYVYVLRPLPNLESLIVHADERKDARYVCELIGALQHLTAVKVTGVVHKEDRRAVLDAAASLPCCRSVQLHHRIFWARYCRALPVDCSQTWNE